MDIDKHITVIEEMLLEELAKLPPYINEWERKFVSVEPLYNDPDVYKSPSFANYLFSYLLIVVSLFAAGTFMENLILRKKTKQLVTKSEDNLENEEPPKELQPETQTPVEENSEEVTENEPEKVPVNKV